MNRARIALALVIGLISSTRFSADPLSTLAVGLLVTLPAYLALTIVTRLLDKHSHESDAVMNLVWEFGFLLAVLVIGSGLGMFMASSLGWSAAPHTLRYPLIITVFATASLLVGYHFTSPISRTQTR